jgi:PEGA domain
VLTRLPNLVSMNARRLLLLVLIALVPLPAAAQADDLLTPLTPSTEKTKKTHRKSKRTREERPQRDNAGEPTAAPPVKGKGRLLVRGSGLPPRAVVLVDGQEVKPGVGLELDQGPHTVTVRRPGFREFSSQTAIVADRTLELSPTLEAVAGVLSVVADVPGSQVLVDGARIGEAPVQDVTLAPGQHEVILRRDGFEDHVSRLSVRAGQDYTVAGTLKPKPVAAAGAERMRLIPQTPQDPVDRGVPLASTSAAAKEQHPAEVDLYEPSPWYGRWYVWAGVGAVVVAGVASAIVVSQGSAVAPLDPSGVCNGPCTGTINAPGARIGF